MPATASLRLLAGIAALALLGALGLQYLGGLRPCTLCIWARYPYLVVIAAAAVGLWLGRPRTALAVVALALAFSVGLAIYHVGVEQGVFALMESCAAVGEASGTPPLRRGAADRAGPVARRLERLIGRPASGAGADGAAAPTAPLSS
jgi:disulfide bond formation protein DsbB